jgi:glycosyltransferase involved in cell wall biosynthesis
MERVLFIVKAREFGGLEIVLLDWLSHVDYSRVSIVVACYGTDALRQKLAALAPRVEVVSLNIPDGASFLAVLPKWLRLFSSLGAHKIVFLEAMVGDFGQTPILAAWLSNRKNVYLFEANWGRAVASPDGKRKLHYGFLPGIGLYIRIDKFAQRLRARVARHIFVVSQGIKDNLVAHYAYPAARTSVLYHGVNTARYCPSPAEREEFRGANGIPQDATVIVTHGRLVRRKRVDRLLEAFERLYTDHRNLWLLLTCYGPLKDEIETSVSNSPANSRVKLVGFQDDPTCILKASDIYVLSSNDEGFGIALVEALSTGLVCVATNGPGPTDILAGGENGFLIEPTLEGVLAGLRRALTLASEERVFLIERARKAVESRFEINLAIRTALDALEIPRE